MSESGVSLETLLIYVEQAVMGDRKLLVKLFRELQRLAHQASAPPEERALGEILGRVLMGDREPDLSHLPPEIAAELALFLERLKTAPLQGAA